jgi:signal peptidase II
LVAKKIWKRTDYRLALFRLVVFLGPALVSLGVDLLTKQWMFNWFEVHATSVELIPSFLYFSRAENTGVAFGMLQGHNEILGIFVALMAIGMPLYGYWHRKEGTLFLFALGLVYGGALGNLHDRWFISYVRDFIDVRFGSYHYPVFNAADAFICIGVGLLILQSWLATRAAKT